MNERIRELAVQSGMSKLVDSWEYERFAELIIQECARVAIATPCPITDEVSLQSQGHTWDMATIEASLSIKEHFKDQ